MPMQFPGIEAEGPPQIRLAKPARFDAGISRQNFVEKFSRAPAQAIHRARVLKGFKALRLCEGVRRKGGREGLQIHQRTRWRRV